MSELIIVHTDEEDSYYRTINLTAVLDSELSWKAKGIHTYIRTRPNDWKIWSQDLLQRAVDGGSSLRGGIKELIEKKYLFRGPIKDEKQRIKYWVYISFNRPHKMTSLELEKLLLEKPLVENPHMEKAHVENQRYSGKDIDNKNKKKKRKKKVDVANATAPSFLKEKKETQKPLKRKPRLYNQDSSIHLSSFLILKILTDLEKEFNKNEPRNFSIRSFSFGKGRYNTVLSKIVEYIKELRKNHSNKKSPTLLVKDYLRSVYDYYQNVGRVPELIQFSPSSDNQYRFEEEWIKQWERDAPFPYWQIHKHKDDNKVYDECGDLKHERGVQFRQAG